MRTDLVPAMIALSTAADKPLRAQVAEAISIIASSDFPGRWPDLIDVSLFGARDQFSHPLTCPGLRNWLAASPMKIIKSTLAFWRPLIRYSARGVQKRDPMAYFRRSTTSLIDLQRPSSNSFRTPRIYFFHPVFREMSDWSLRLRRYLLTFSLTSPVKIYLQTSKIPTYSSSDPRACS